MPGGAPIKKKISIPDTNSRFDKWLHGWLLGKQGLEGAGIDLAHSVDPRTSEGRIGLLGMLAGGKPNGENALAAHLGHSEFRPYRNPGFNEEGLLGPGDAHIHGGMMPSGGDLGYTQGGQSMGAFRAIHGYSLPEILGLVSSQRVRRLNKLEHTPYLLKQPYKSIRGLNN